MATDYFMKIDGIPGDSTDKTHKDEIQVASWSWGETATPTSGGGGGGGSRPDLHDLHFTARTSKASPLLFGNCAAGAHMPTAVLTGRKAGDRPIEYLKITLSDVQITSYQVAGNENDNVPLDQVSLFFNKIQISYTPQAADGTAGTPITRGWDRLKSQAI